MKGGMRSRRARMNRTIYSPATLSSWGRRVAWVRAEFNLSYRDISSSSGLHTNAIMKMVHNPLYEPFYSDGIRFLRWYNARKRDSLMGTIPPRRADYRQ